MWNRLLSLIVLAFFFLLPLEAGAWSADPRQLIRSARQQVGVTLDYDPSYRALSYPGGDVPLSTGVCTDVLVRALRAQDIDLQKKVHEDMRAHFTQYPQRWGLRRPDTNIDHRRVPNLMMYFRRQGFAVAMSTDPTAFAPGDIVAWDLGGGVTHIGIVSDRSTTAATPLVLHNIGRGAREENILFAYTMIGHYRLTAP
jgi:uncharacterized protein